MLYDSVYYRASYSAYFNRGFAGYLRQSLVAITLILGVVGLPLEAIALILAVDRILDMCRTRSLLMCTATPVSRESFRAKWVQR